MSLLDLAQYKENNRLEAKRALGGLPESIWESYSAFANTQGGVILLGVEEYSDKSLHAVELPDPDKLISDFWNGVNNRQKVSVNILSNKHVQKRQADGRTIVVITVPKAERFDRPVYLGDNPFTGSYRRNGEGDYRCTKEEVQAMLRDASVKTQDLLVLDNMDMSVIDYDSLRRYRIRMKNYRPGHVWEELEDEEFLYCLGAAGRSEDGKLHPTAAGLLMFGHEYEIVKEYPNYFLDYRECLDKNTRWTDRIVSSSGDWSGNIYDFYFRVYNKLAQAVKVPFALRGGDRIDDTPVHKALREALANCLVNADYYGRRGIVIVLDRESITFSNPGNFRIDIDVAKSGGVSDPRNGALIKMFNLIDIGERAGSGIPNFLAVWEKLNFGEPEMHESFEPERITIKFSLPSDLDDKNSDNSGYSSDKIQKNRDNSIADSDNQALGSDKNITRQQFAIIEYLNNNKCIGTAKAAEILGVKAARARQILSGMVASGLIVAEGANKNRTYHINK